MKRNLIFSNGLASMVGAGAIVSAGLVIANEKPNTGSYDPVSGIFYENGVHHSFSTWEHARQCALEGRLPQLVLDRLGAWGDEATRAEAENLKAENRRVSSLRESKKLNKLSMMNDTGQNQHKLSDNDQEPALGIYEKEVSITQTKSNDEVSLSGTIAEKVQHSEARMFSTDHENSTDWMK